MKELPDLKQRSETDKDALIQTLWEELQKMKAPKPKKDLKEFQPAALERLQSCR